MPRQLAGILIGVALLACAGVVLPVRVDAATSRAETTNAPQEASVPPPHADAPQDDERGLFEPGTLGVEFGGAFLGEAWNLNDRREWLADGSAAVWWAFSRRATLVVEFHATRVFQSPARDAFVNGFLPLVRWRVLERRVGTLFVEVGPGISWSDTRTPPRGTQFNYLVQGGAGLARRLGPRASLVTGFRWLHISNNSREGRGRNPDIEALGGYAGLALAF